MKRSRKQKQQEVVLTTELNGATLIKRYSQRLAEHGIEEGSSLELARAFFPDLHAQPFTPEKDFEALKKLAGWLTRFTPLVGIDREALHAAKTDELLYLDSRYSGVLLNVTGTERLYGGEKPAHGIPNLARKIYRALTKHGFVVRIGVAPTIGAAWALSRYNKNPFAHVKTKKELRENLTTLPLEALRLSHKTVRGLHELGLYDIQALLPFPRKELALRFGVKLLRAIDEFFGDVPEPLTPVHVPEALREERPCDPPLVTRQQIAEGTLLVLHDLLKRAEELHRKPFLFRFILTGMDTSYRTFLREKRISLHAATSDVKYLRSILSPIIESIRFPGTVSEITLEVCDEGIAKPSQVLSEQTFAAPEHAPKELLNTLSLQLGGGALRALAFRESHLPEKSYQYRFLSPGEVPKPQKKNAFSLPAFAYPSYIFQRAQPIRALSLLPDHPPVRITWKTREYKIFQSIGPERVCGEWWEYFMSKERSYEEREYFRLLDETGRWLWVYRKRSDLSWHIQGVWA